MSQLPFATIEELRRAKIIHEARIAYCWGKHAVGLRDPWPDFTQPRAIENYGHNPVPWVDIALAQIRALDR